MFLSEAICLCPVFVNLGQWKIAIKKTVQDLSNEFLVQFLFKNLTILLEGIQVIKFNCGLLLDSRDTNTSSFCRLPASNLGCGRWGSSNLLFYKFNIPCTLVMFLTKFVSLSIIIMFKNPSWDVINPLSPVSDQDRISSYYIYTKSCRQVMRIEKNINIIMGLLIDPIPNSPN